MPLRVEKIIIHLIIMVENDVITFSWLFLNGSFSYLQVTRTCIKALMGLNFGQIPPLTSELAAHMHLNNQHHHFF